MKSVRYVLFIVLGIFILYVKLKTGGTNGSTTAPGGVVAPPATTVAPAGSAAVPAASAPAPAESVQPADNGAIPQKALTVLQYVRQNGQPPDGYVGGRVFDNREGRLPAGGDYREFDVDPHNGQRNAERLIVEWTTKKAWYTGDHYQTFIPAP